MLRHVPTMEQCIDVENSQSFLRCPLGLSNGSVDWRLDSRNLNAAGGASIALMLGGVITGFGGTIVILRPWVILEKPDRDVHQSLQSPHIHLMHRKGVRRDSRRHADRPVSLVPPWEVTRDHSSYFNAFWIGSMMSTANGHDCTRYRIYCQLYIDKKRGRSGIPKTDMAGENGTPCATSKEGLAQRPECGNSRHHCLV